MGGKGKPLPFLSNNRVGGVALALFGLASSLYFLKNVLLSPKGHGHEKKEELEGEDDDVTLDVRYIPSLETVETVESLPFAQELKKRIVLGVEVEVSEDNSLILEQIPFRTDSPSPTSSTPPSIMTNKNNTNNIWAHQLIRNSLYGKNLIEHALQFFSRETRTLIAILKLGNKVCGHKGKITMSTIVFNTYLNQLTCIFTLTHKKKASCTAAW
jgi:hypothetical protein